MLPFLAGSLKKVFLGIFLLFGAVGLLWWNEGRVDLSKMANQAIALNPQENNNAADGKLVVLRGIVSSSQTLNDPGFLTEGDFIQLARKVEVYSWIEKTIQRTDKSSDGTSKTTTLYKYEKTWTESPADSKRFHEPSGHENPKPALSSKTFILPSAKLGIYTLHPELMAWPSPTPLLLTPESTRVEKIHQKSIQNSFLFLGNGSLETPQVGDLRLSYRAILANQEYTVFGKRKDHEIEPYTDSKGNQLYRAFEEGREKSIAQLHEEFLAITYSIRLLGFLSILLGLNLLASPFHLTLGMVPILGRLGKGIIRLLSCILALMLSGLVVLISKLAHNLFFLLAFLSALLGILVLLVQIQKRKPNATTSGE